jgi:hypothetical protein
MRNRICLKPRIRRWHICKFCPPIEHDWPINLPCEEYHYYYFRWILIMWGQKKNLVQLVERQCHNLHYFLKLLYLYLRVLLSSLICSQIWLIPLVDDCQWWPITQFENKTLVRKWFQIQRKQSCNTLGGYVKNWRKTYSSESFNGMGWFWTMSHFGGS